MESLLPNTDIPWLLQSNPWTRYRTLTELLGKDKADPMVKSALEELDSQPLMQSLFQDCENLYPKAITRHNNAKIPYYKLWMLADFGYTKDDPGIRKIIAQIKEHKEDGLYSVRQSLPEKGKMKPDSDAETWHALPCDSPYLTAALLRFSDDDENTLEAAGKIAKLWQDEKGWFCWLPFVKGIFKKTGIGCPMAGLMALSVFASVPDLTNSDAAKNAFAPIRYHWESEKSLYYFGRSKKFWSFKYPFIWYNALYMADILARFPQFRDEPLVKELVDWIVQSADGDGRFTPNSMFMNFKGWDFANKKEPSPWITFLAYRVLKRYYS